MIRILLFFLILNFQAFSLGNKCEALSAKNNFQGIRFHKFSVFQVKPSNEMRMYETRQTIKDEVEKLKVTLKDLQDAKLENLQKQIIQKYLITRQSSRKFLVDFHADRYF